MKLKYFAIFWMFAFYRLAASTMISKSINNFVTKIDKILTDNNDFSYVLCPFNLHLGLSLLQQGAGGETAKELSSLLGLPDNKQETKSSYKALLDTLTGESFKTWTCMIPGENFELKKDFVATAHRFFKAGAAGTSQSDDGADTDVMLKYCNNIGSRPKTTKLQMFSKAGFNSSWKKSFFSAEYNEFIVSTEEKVKIKMMTLNEVFPFKEDTILGAKVLKLRFKEEGWGLLIVLPSGNESLSSLQSKIAESPLPNLITNLEDVKLEVTIPKFNAYAFNFHRDIKFLKKMGAKTLFSNEADFNEVSTEGKMHLSHVLVEAFVAVNETGILAGSGADFLAGGINDEPAGLRSPPAKKPTDSTNTAGVLQPHGSAHRFTANRPFLFYIFGPNDVFIYSGKIVNPTNQKSEKRL